MSDHMDKEIRDFVTEVATTTTLEARSPEFAKLDPETKGMAFQTVLTTVIAKKEGKVIVLDKAVYDNFKRITPKKDWINVAEHRAPFERLAFVIYDHELGLCDKLIAYTEFDEAKYSKQKHPIEGDTLSAHATVWEIKKESQLAINNRVFVSNRNHRSYRLLNKDEARVEMIYTLLCYEALVNSKSFEPVKQAALPSKLAKKRQNKDKSAFVGGYTVIEPKRYSSSESTGNGAKKRMHLRRGHWRHLKGKTVWVNSCVVGNGELIPRDGYILKKGENHEQLPKS